jgi:hypothetical protein
MTCNFAVIVLCFGQLYVCARQRDEDPEGFPERRTVLRILSCGACGGSASDPLGTGI